MDLAKLCACGNDFIATRYQGDIDYSSLSIKLCNRYTGVGGSGLIILKENPLEMIIYDNLGKLVLFDSNAFRCFIRYVSYLNITRGKRLEVLTGAGIRECEITSEIPFMVTINLGKPNYNNSMLYVNDSLDSFGRIIRINNIDINTYSLNLGGVNTVMFIDSFNSKYLDYKDLIINESIFKHGTTLSYVVVKNMLNIEIKSFDKYGPLKASGSAAASAVVVAHRLGLIKGRCNVLSDEFNLRVEIGKKDNVYLSGPARVVFTLDYKEEE